MFLSIPYLLLHTRRPDFFQRRLISSRASSPIPMAAPSIFIFLCFLAQAQSFTFSNLLILPLNKHQPSLQYLTTVSHGSPPRPADLVLDLGAPFVWIDLPSCRLSGSSRPVVGRSVECSRATFSFARGSDVCEIFLVNSFTGRSLRGELVEDAFGFGSTTVVSRFLHSCGPGLLLHGLVKGARGVLGLARSPISFPSQVAAEFNSARGFFLCLSSSTGAVILNIGNRGSLLGPGISELLTYTPLVRSRENLGHKYLININSIKINDRKIPINSSSTPLTTTVPYTTMESSVFAAFASNFKEAAVSMVMEEVSPVAPFRLCFSSNGSPEAPAMEFILQSGTVRWKMKGRNSMVNMGDGMRCLGFLDGGDEQKSAMVLGGYQMEEVLLHFDLESDMLGFSSSLIEKSQMSCSDLPSQSTPNPSL